MKYLLILSLFLIGCNIEISSKPNKNFNSYFNCRIVHCELIINNKRYCFREIMMFNKIRYESKFLTSNCEAFDKEHE